MPDYKILCRCIVFLVLSPYVLVFVALLPSLHLALVLFSSLCFRLLLFLTDGYYFWFPLFMGQSIVLYFFWTVWLCLWVYIYVCIFHYFSYQLPDFVTDLCLWCVFCFSSLCCFNPI